MQKQTTVSPTPQTEKFANGWIDLAFSRFETVYDLKYKPERLAAMKAEWKKIFRAQPIIPADGIAAVDYCIRVSKKMPTIPEFSEYWRLIVKNKTLNQKKSIEAPDNFLSDYFELTRELSAILKNAEFKDEEWNYDVVDKIQEQIKTLRKCVLANNPELDRIQQLKEMMRMVK